MSSFNNRLRQVIALHRLSERHRKFGPTFVRGEQARALKGRLKARRREARS